ncbi:MAG TPA: hypothetical protein VHA12_03350 [Candidatus Nanoarchaeia archaeon]|nr:hypothetical protein [Candidatus Nanoarchaeia archaeon]
MKNLLLICREGLNRSPAAAAIFGRELEERGYFANVTAAGIEKPKDGASSRLTSVMFDKGYRGFGDREKRTILLTPTLIDKADLILTMTSDQRDCLLENFPAATQRLFTLANYATNGKDNFSIEHLDPRVLSMGHPHSNEEYSHQAEVASWLPNILARYYLHFFADGAYSSRDHSGLIRPVEKMVRKMEKYVPLAVNRMKKEGFFN